MKPWVFFPKCSCKEFYQPQKCHRFLTKLQVNCFFLITYLVCLNDLQGAGEAFCSEFGCRSVCPTPPRDVYPARQGAQMDAELELLARCVGNTFAVPAQGSAGCKTCPSRGDSPLLRSVLGPDRCRSLLDAAWLRGCAHKRLEFHCFLACIVPRRGLGLCWKRV